MTRVTFPAGGGQADTRKWWHLLGKWLLCMGLFVGVAPPFLFYYLMDILPWQKRPAPVMFWLPLAAAAVAFAGLVREVPFARLLVIASYLFLVVGPVMFLPTNGGSLHGGEIVLMLPILSGLLAWGFAAPGIMLWKRRAAPPAADGPNPWSSPAVQPSVKRLGLK